MGRRPSVPNAVERLDCLLAGTCPPAEALTHLAALVPEHLTLDDWEALWQRLWALRAPAPSFSLPVLDCCGTGGSGGAAPFNTSTAVAFILAAAGVPVVKFGNRAASSASGSTDFLEAGGFSGLLPLEAVAHMVAECGVAFLAAPTVYPVLKALQPVRQAFGRRTVFNDLGPLLNPVVPAWRLLGVSSASTLTTYQSLLPRLFPHAPRTLLHRSASGADELVGHEAMTTVLLTPNNTPLVHQPPELADACIPPLARAPLPLHEGWDATSNWQRWQAIVNSQDTQSAVYGRVVLNAAVGLWLAEQVASVADGVPRVQALLASGHVARVVDHARQVHLQAQHEQRPLPH